MFSLVAEESAAKFIVRIVIFVVLLLGWKTKVFVFTWTLLAFILI
jgi:hypothetical protein